MSLARLIESHYRRPMDIEWCLDGSTLYIVQARPLTALPVPPPAGSKSGGPLPETSRSAPSEEGLLLKGLGAAPGTVAGRVRLVLHVEENTQLQPGEILVSTMTTPDMVPAMARAGAIVTDEGGMTCHAAIVSRELGIPCVVGTRTATKTLREAQEVSSRRQDGRRLRRTRAGTEEGVRHSDGDGHGGRTPPPGFPSLPRRSTSTSASPKKRRSTTQLPVQGVGLLRIEFIFTAHVREHPLSLIQQGRGKELVDRLAEGIAQVCRAFHPRPVIVRTSDFKTNEVLGHARWGGLRAERGEPDDRLARMLPVTSHPSSRPAFLLELEAIHKVRTELGLRNAHVMLPFVRNTWELEQIAEMLKEKGLRRSRDFKLYLMAEVPSIVFLARDFSKHCDGFSIGSNDLTQLVLGAARDSETLARLGYFDERDPAVLRAIEMLIEAAHAEGRSVGICGQGPSVYPEFAEFLVKCGIDSISLNADTVLATTRTIAALEQKMKLNRAAKVLVGLLDLPTRRAPSRRCRRAAGRQAQLPRLGAVRKPNSAPPLRSPGPSTDGRAEDCPTTSQRGGLAEPHRTVQQPGDEGRRGPWPRSEGCVTTPWIPTDDRKRWNNAAEAGRPSRSAITGTRFSSGSG